MTKLFEYPFTIVGVEGDFETKVATLKLVAASPVYKVENEHEHYGDTVIALGATIELPAAMVYTGNVHHRVIKSEYKDLIGTPIMLSIKTCEESTTTEKA